MGENVHTEIVPNHAGGLPMRRAMLALVLGFSMLFCVPTAEAGQKYPPYPDTWLFEVPLDTVYGSDTCKKMVETPSGDYLLLYGPHGGRLLFEGRDVRLSEQEYRGICGDHRRDLLSGRTYRFSLGDGSEVFQMGPHPKCYVPFRAEIWVRHPDQGPTTRMFAIVAPLAQPRRETRFNPFCEGADTLKEKYILERFDSPVCDMVKLADDTYLVFLAIHGTGLTPTGRYIVRFRGAMETKADFFGKHGFHLIDLDDLNRYLETRGGDSVQDTIDGTMEYLEKKKPKP